ncbi:hypothetical protein [Streptomyces sparsus]
MASAAEVRPIERRLESLRAETREFVSSIEDDAEWRKDEDNTTRNNDLHQDVSVAVAQFWAAERRARTASSDWSAALRGRPTTAPAESTCTA